MGLQPPAAPRSVNFRKFSGSGGFIRAQFGRGAPPSGGEVYLGMATAALGADKIAPIRRLIPTALIIDLYPLSFGD